MDQGNTDVSNCVEDTDLLSPEGGPSESVSSSLHNETILERHSRGKKSHGMAVAKSRRDRTARVPGEHGALSDIQTKHGNSSDAARGLILASGWDFGGVHLPRGTRASDELPLCRSQCLEEYRIRAASLLQRETHNYYYASIDHDSDRGIELKVPMIARLRSAVVSVSRTIFLLN